MPPYSKSHGTSEGSHFSGRPPPPYALIDLTLESYASLVEAAERRTPINVFGKSHIFSEQGELEFETTDSLQSTSFHDADSGHSQSILLEFDHKLVQLMTCRSNKGESTVSSSEDGGVLLPPSSKSESLQSFPNDTIGQQYFNIIRQRKTIFWQDYKHLPSPQIEKLWEQKLSQLTSLANLWASQVPSSPQQRPPPQLGHARPPMIMWCEALPWGLIVRTPKKELSTPHVLSHMSIIESM
jgi:hypothetical protein